MKLKWKISLLCIAIYLSTLAAAGFVVTENTYSSLLNREIQRALQEEKNMRDSTSVYLIAKQKTSEDRLDVKDFSKTIVDMYSSDNVIIELFDAQKNPLEASQKKDWGFKREDLDKLTKEGRNYVIRKDKASSYLFINDHIKGETGELLLSYIKDISDLEVQRREQYFLFLRIGLVGLIIIAAVVELLSRALIKPVVNLGITAEKIASGSYEERVSVSGRDEVSKLGHQFNRMAGEIEKKVKELQEEGERKQRFIDNLTHELRTPLTSVIGYAELLQKLKYDEAAFAKGLGYVHSEGLRMLKLVNSLMEMILMRRGSLNLEPVNMPLLLKEAAALIEIKARDKKLELLVQAEDLVAHIDRDMIKGAILNLVDNAIKASREGGRITIGCEKIEQNFTVYVQDQGKGIEQSEIPQLTEAFYRVDKARARKEGGLGLGLALCRQIAESHGGRIHIESEVGKGTKVSLILKALKKGEEEIA